MQRFKDDPQGSKGCWTLWKQCGSESVHNPVGTAGWNRWLVPSMKSPAERTDLSNNERIDAVFPSLNYQINQSDIIAIWQKYHGYQITLMLHFYHPRRKSSHGFVTETILLCNFVYLMCKSWPQPWFPWACWEMGCNGAHRSRVKSCGLLF